MDQASEHPAPGQPSHEHPAYECLIRTPNLLVRRVAHPSAACVVTFGNYRDGAGADAPDPESFGASFLDRQGIDAIHVTSRGNDWYQYPEVPEVLAAIRAAAGPGRRVVTYGSSMGGYAAIRFAGALGAAEAAAISPQYSLDPLLVPFERRWRAEARRIRFLSWPGLGPDDAVPPPATVFYDPRGADGRHVELWAATRPVTRVPVPYAAHPAGTYLAETGLLGPAVLDLVACRLDAPALVREARARRRRSGKYLMTLAAAQPGCRRGLALRLARMAADAVPVSTDYASRLAIMLYRAGREDEADAWHRRALDLAPDDPGLLFRYSLFLQRVGRFGPALDLARRAARARPAEPRLQRHVQALEHLGGPASPARLRLRLRNAAAHRLVQLAWRRGWSPIGRLGAP